MINSNPGSIMHYKRSLSSAPPGEPNHLGGRRATWGESRAQTVVFFASRPKS